jgi:hypothetical protein
MHQWIHIRFQFIAIDNWINDTLYLDMDAVNNYDEANVYSSVNLAKSTFYNIRLFTDMCKNTSYADALGIMDAGISHNTSMIKLRIHTNYLNLTNTSSNLFWAFKNLMIVVGQCASNCLTCNSSSSSACLSCVTNYLLVNGTCVCDTTNNNYYLSQCLPKCETN